MTIAQAHAWNDALFRRDGGGRDGRDRGGRPVPEIRTAADLDALLEKARAGEFIL